MLNQVRPLLGVRHGPLSPPHMALNQFKGMTHGWMGLNCLKNFFCSCKVGAVYVHMRLKKAEIAKAS